MIGYNRTNGRVTYAKTVAKLFLSAEDRANGFNNKKCFKSTYVEERAAVVSKNGESAVIVMLIKQRQSFRMDEDNG